MADVSNRSGGADFNAQSVNVGKDVIGRDQIVHTTINNYFASISPSRNDIDNVARTTDSEEETRGGVRPISDLVRDYFGLVEYLYEHRGELEGIPTGFIDLDKILLGMQRSDLVVVAARSSGWRTSFVLSVALNIALKFYQRVAVFTLTESSQQIVQRLLSSLAGISTQRLRIGDLKEEEWPRFVQASNDLSAATIFIDDTTNIPTAQLRAKTLRLFEEYGIDVVIIDGLQLLTGDPSGLTWEQDAPSIIRVLKNLAKEMNVPLLVTSEVNQAVERRMDKRPVLNDFDESMLIERYADVVLFIHRNDLYDLELGRKNIAEIIVAKHRHGPTGTVELFYQTDPELYRNAIKRELAQ
jgi:replicative DNA helicase